MSLTMWILFLLVGLLAGFVFALVAEIVNIYRTNKKERDDLKADYDKRAADLKADYDKLVADLKADYDKRADQADKVAQAVRSEYVELKAALNVEFSKGLRSKRSEDLALYQRYKDRYSLFRNDTARAADLGVSKSTIDRLNSFVKKLQKIENASRNEAENKNASQT